MKVYKARVKSNKWVSSRYKHLILHLPEVLDQCKPGQFFHLRCSKSFNPLLRRPMSTYQIRPEKGELHFLYLVKGAGTKLIAQLQEGDAIDLFGPLGKGFELEPSWRNILVLARGVGLATLGPLAEMASQQKHKDTCCIKRTYT